MVQEDSVCMSSFDAGPALESSTSTIQNYCTSIKSITGEIDARRAE